MHAPHSKKLACTWCTVVKSTCGVQCCTSCCAGEWNHQPNRHTHGSIMWCCCSSGCNSAIAGRCEAHLHMWSMECAMHVHTGHQHPARNSMHASHSKKLMCTMHSAAKSICGMQLCTDSGVGGRGSRPNRHKHDKNRGQQRPSYRL